MVHHFTVQARSARPVRRNRRRVVQGAAVLTISAASFASALVAHAGATAPPAPPTSSARLDNSGPAEGGGGCGGDDAPRLHLMWRRPTLTRRRGSTSSSGSRPVVVEHAWRAGSGSSSSTPGTWVALTASGGERFVRRATRRTLPRPDRSAAARRHLTANSGDGSARTRAGARHVRRRVHRLRGTLRGLADDERRGDHRRSGDNVTPYQAQTDALNQELALYWRIAQSVLAQATGVSTTTVACHYGHHDTIRSPLSASTSATASAGTQPAAVAAAITIQNFAFGTGWADRRLLGTTPHWSPTLQQCPHADGLLRHSFSNTGTTYIRPGSATITLDQPGTYAYHCTFTGEGTTGHRHRRRTSTRPASTAATATSTRPGRADGCVRRSMILISQGGPCEPLDVTRWGRPTSTPTAVEQDDEHRGHG